MVSEWLENEKDPPKEYERKSSSIIAIHAAFVENRGNMSSYTILILIPRIALKQTWLLSAGIATVVLQAMKVLDSDSYQKKFRYIKPNGRRLVPILLPMMESKNLLKQSMKSP